MPRGVYDRSKVKKNKGVDTTSAKDSTPKQKRKYTKRSGKFAAMKKGIPPSEILGTGFDEKSRSSNYDLREATQHVETLASLSTIVLANFPGELQTLTTQVKKAIQVMGVCFEEVYGHLLPPSDAAKIVVDAADPAETTDTTVVAPKRKGRPPKAVSSPTTETAEATPAETTDEASNGATIPTPVPFIPVPSNA